MSICSAHQIAEKNCSACNVNLLDVLPNWKNKIAEAIASGITICKCGFEYYNTAGRCPLCSRKK